jgi:hypothetical protein
MQTLSAMFASVVLDNEKTTRQLFRPGTTARRSLPRGRAIVY